MRAAGCILALILCGASAEARLQENVQLRVDAQARISLGSCFNNLALSGYAPVDVTINNDSGRTQRWVLDFSSPAYTYGQGLDTIDSTFTVTVEDNGTRTIPLMVPMTDSLNSQGPLRARISGYGADQTVEQTIGGRSQSGKQATPFVVISDSLGTSIWSELSKRLETDGRDLSGSTVNPDELPEDWRGLSGVAALWLTGDELNHLSAAQRNALGTWVRAGGRLSLCGAQAAPPDFAFAGFGQVNLLRAPLDIDETRRTIRYLQEEDRKYDAYATPERSALAGVDPNVLLLSAFMGLFAIVIGPVNVFVLAKRHRARLFWTTPLISLCASGLLMGTIVVQDGLGGHGLRSAVVCLFPQSRSAIVMQEQLSRTGLLIGSAFQTRDPVCMRQLEVDLRKSPPYGTGPAGRELSIDGNSYGKDWFASRAAQAQRILSVASTRAEVTLLNAPDVANGAAPIVISSFGATLNTLYYTGANRAVWEGHDIATGQKQTLKPLPPGSAPVRPAHLPGVSLGKFLDQPGAFWATADGGGDYVATLGSIHWKDSPVTYVGPVTNAP